MRVLVASKKILSDWTHPPDLQVCKVTEFVHLFLSCKLAVKNDTKVMSCIWKWDVTVIHWYWKRRSISGGEPIRRISVLLSFNWSLFSATQTFTSEMQDLMVHTRVNASEGESDLYSSVSSANVWWETEWWLITSETGWVYKAKITGSRTEPWGTPKVRSKGEDFTSFTATICVLPCR